jgi:hypothetical protein
VAQCVCGEPNRKEAFNIGHGKTFAIVYNIDRYRYRYRYRYRF